MKGTQKSQAPEEKPAPLLFANKGTEQPLVIQAREETVKGGHQGKQNVPKIAFPTGTKAPTLLLTRTEAALCTHPPHRQHSHSKQTRTLIPPTYFSSLLSLSPHQLPPALPLLGAPWHRRAHAHALLARRRPRSSRLEDAELG